MTKIRSRGWGKAGQVGKEQMNEINWRTGKEGRIRVQEWLEMEGREAEKALQILSRMEAANNRGPLRDKRRLLTLYIQHGDLWLNADSSVSLNYVITEHSRQKRSEELFNECHRHVGSSSPWWRAADRTENSKYNREDFTGGCQLRENTHTHTDIRLFQFGTRSEVWHGVWLHFLLLICISKLCICISLSQLRSCLGCRVHGSF